ncbi:P-loop containing nucleoside triphosphate hydrolase protein [Lasiosphaeria hispida]|uniref:P-loop containing nucleoside triphosphate hydrolase protein n=1 Tax=Lasiosphaeria hispida TaxID=260671 RepID=A0AAJ0HET0_9PEZI|nr:P-loop containing nucleoside triphosphate hydrolase protein [Lasiosphaeria hispida]
MSQAGHYGDGLSLPEVSRVTDRPPTHETVVIVLMGVTGSGKSTFISLLADQPVRIGHGLESSTVNASFYSFMYDETKEVILVDTPGFDDTTRSDADVLKEVAFLLAALHNNNARLVGIVYLHRITDPRISGSGMKNLRILQKLCGPSSFKSVALATNMWSEVESQPEAKRVALQRQTELRENFWGAMVDQGSIMTRHDGSLDSARDIVRTLVDRDVRVLLNIQRELAVEKKTLDETEAGQYVQKEILEAKKRYERELVDLQESMDEALNEKDEETFQALRAEKEAAEAKATQTEKECQRLNLTMQQLNQEESTRYQRLALAMEQEDQMARPHQSARSGQPNDMQTEFQHLERMEQISQQHEQDLINLEITHQNATLSLINHIGGIVQDQNRAHHRQNRHSRGSNNRPRRGDEGRRNNGGWWQTPMNFLKNLVLTQPIVAQEVDRHLAY